MSVVLKMDRIEILPTSIVPYAHKATTYSELDVLKFKCNIVLSD